MSSRGRSVSVCSLPMEWKAMRISSPSILKTILPYFRVDHCRMTFCLRYCGPQRASVRGDEVFAVGHPFGIGPSLTAGVISGFRRTYQTSPTRQVITNLIQFDAAANPRELGRASCNSRRRGYRIVTAILSPKGQNFFVGIGFAVPIDTAAAAVGESPFLKRPVLQGGGYDA